jgi:hypothetical protein
VVPCTNSTTSTPFLSQKTAAISFLVDNVFYTFSACLLNVCASSALTALWFQHSQMKLRFHHLLLIQCDWEIHHNLCGITLKKSKPSHSLYFVHTHEHFRNPSWAKLLKA